MDGRAWGDELAERAFKEAVAGIDTDGQAQETPKTGRGGAVGATNTPPTGPSDPPALRTALTGRAHDDFRAIVEGETE